MHPFGTETAAALPPRGSAGPRLRRADGYSPTTPRVRRDRNTPVPVAVVRGSSAARRGESHPVCGRARPPTSSHPAPADADSRARGVPAASPWGKVPRAGEGEALHRSARAAQRPAGTAPAGCGTSRLQTTAAARPPPPHQQLWVSPFSTQG